MGFGYNIPRIGVVLPGIPFSWHTNMQDEDIFDLYLLIKDDSDIVGQNAKIEVTGLLSLSFRVFDKFLNFKNGACHCIGFQDTIIAIYKTTPEWAVWTAHQKEVKELREEQRLERQIERMLVDVEINFLTSKFNEGLNAKNYNDAYQTLCTRIDLMRRNGIYWDRAEKNMRLSGLPLEYCLRVLNQYARFGSDYVDLAGAIAFWKRTISNEDAETLFLAAINRFPSDGMLFKKICLFWERQKALDRAIRFCALALSRQLTDDTKGGFATRIKRLKKKAEKSN